MISPLPNTPAILINDILIPILDAFSKFKAHLSVFSGEKTNYTYRYKEAHLPVGRVRRERKERIFSVSPQSHSLFLASFQTFCLTARAYLNTQKYGLFCSRVNRYPFMYLKPEKGIPFGRSLSVEALSRCLTEVTGFIPLPFILWSPVLFWSMATLLIPFAIRSSWVSYSLDVMALNTPAKLAGPPRTRVHAPWGSPFILVSFYMSFTQEP